MPLTEVRVTLYQMVHMQILQVFSCCSHSWQRVRYSRLKEEEAIKREHPVMRGNACIVQAAGICRAGERLTGVPRKGQDASGANKTGPIDTLRSSPLVMAVRTLS
jgi:hypothetical protein